MMDFARLGGCVALLLIFLYPEYHHTYGWSSDDIFIEQTNRTWKNASRYCTLYGSDKAPSDVDSVQNIPRPVSMDGSLHWVGATATFTPWFKFVGCYVYSSIFSGSLFKSRSAVIGPVADCYLQCKSNFGVSETRCFCSWVLGERQQNETCKLMTSGTFRTDVIGIGALEYFDFNYQIAMYNIIDGTLKIKDNSDGCLMNTDTGFSSQPCDSIDSAMRTWTEAIIGGLTSNGNSSQWTPFVRRRIIRWAEETDFNLNETECVSVRETMNKKNYDVVVRPCDERLSSICQTDETGGISLEFLKGFAIFVGVLIAIILIGSYVQALLFQGGVACLREYYLTLRYAEHVPHPGVSSPRDINMTSNKPNRRRPQRSRHHEIIDPTRDNEDQTAPPSSSDRSTVNQYTFSEPVKTSVSQKIYYSELTRNNEGQTALQTLLSPSDQYEIASGSTIQSPFGHNESKKLLKSDKNVDDTTPNTQTKKKQNPDGLM